MSSRRESPHKRFVEVIAHCRFDGKIMPLQFCAEGEQSVKIDAVIDVRQAASLKAGGQGIRYICRSEDKEYHLFHDDEWWFIEVD